MTPTTKKACAEAFKILKAAEIFSLIGGILAGVVGLGIGGLIGGLASLIASELTADEETEQPWQEKSIKSYQLNGLRYEDIKFAMKKFNGAKRMMEDAAKLFIEYESKSTNWLALKVELLEEFGRNQNSAMIHEKLRNNQKKEEDSLMEYLYEMLSIASKGDIDIAATLTYTTDGIPGSPNNKSMLYEIKSISEYKEKLALYEIIQSKIVKDQSDERKGPKCFTCNE